MTKPLHLLAINTKLDLHSLADRFATDGRVQIRNVLERPSAEELRRVLAHQTPWGLAWNSGNGPNALDARQFASLPAPERQKLGRAVSEAAHRGDYSFTYARYPIVDAYKERWSPDSAHDILFEHINDAPFLDFIRLVTAMPELVKADAQATLFAPTHFLAKHIDSHVAEGWKVAYVLSLAPDNWLPDWGGYLNFLDEEGDIIAGFKPRFNSLSLFRVPQAHSVSYVPPFAPVGRFSITGWFRDR